MESHLPTGTKKMNYDIILAKQDQYIATDTHIVKVDAHHP